VSDWYDHLKNTRGAPAPSDDGRLMGDVSHAAGNIIHRMYYWAGVLEERGPEGSASREAIRELKDSLGELHRLVKRALDLQRPVKPRPIPIAAGDVVRSIALRFQASGVDIPQAVSAELDAVEAFVDPVQLDRAIGMLEEALVGCRDVDSVDMKAALDSSVSDGNGVLQVECVAHCKVEAGGTIQPHASEEVCIALASKLLRAFQWKVVVEDDGPRRHLFISIPVAPTRRDVNDARNDRKNDSIHGTIA
jgi:hypothetical protein